MNITIPQCVLDFEIPHEFLERTRELFPYVELDGMPCDELSKALAAHAEEPWMKVRFHEFLARFANTPPIEECADMTREPADIESEPGLAAFRRSVAELHAHFDRAATIKRLIADWKLIRARFYDINCEELRRTGYGE